MKKPKKRGVGRPAKTTGEPRTAHVHMRVRPSAKRQAEANAGSAGLTLADYFERRCCRGGVALAEVLVVAAIVGLGGLFFVGACADDKWLHSSGPEWTIGITLASAYLLLFAFVVPQQRHPLLAALTGIVVIPSALVASYCVLRYGLVALGASGLIGSCVLVASILMRKRSVR